MKKLNSRTRKVIVTTTIALIIVVMSSITAFASVEDTLTKTNDLLFSIVRLLGVCFAVWGVYEIAISIPQHDGSARFRAFGALAAAALLVFAKEILSAIGIVAS